MKFCNIYESHLMEVKKKIILVDNYVDVNALNVLCKRNQGTDVVIAT